LANNWSPLFWHFIEAHFRCSPSFLPGRKSLVLFSPPTKSWFRLCRSFHFADIFFIFFKLLLFHVVWYQKILLPSYGFKFRKWALTIWRCFLFWLFSEYTFDLQEMQDQPTEPSPSPPHPPKSNIRYLLKTRGLLHYS